METSQMHEVNGRSGDGLDVRLMWGKDSTGKEELKVTVRDSLSGVDFEIPVGPDQAEDAYEHPFTYKGKIGEIALSGAI